MQHTSAHYDEIGQLRNALGERKRVHTPFPPGILSAEIEQAVSSIKPEAVQMFVNESGFSNDDVDFLWCAADRFLDGLSDLVDLHNRLTLVENNLTPRGLWDHSIRLEPIGTMLVCLPANAVIPLSIILPAALGASGNQLVFSVSGAARNAGLFILSAVQSVLGDRICIWTGGVREAIDGLTHPEPSIDALYYMGASKQYGSIAEKCAEAGVTLLYEGEGRGVVIVDDGLSPHALHEAVEKIVASKAFCLGRMCSAPNSVLIHERIFEAFVAEYNKECLKYSHDGCRLDPATVEIIRGVNALLGAPRPALADPMSACPFYWISTLDEALAMQELFCPGLLLVPVHDLGRCLGSVSQRRFRMQVTLFSPRQSELKNLVSLTSFARYCYGMNPASQDSLLPWGNYGFSGFSDVFDFYRKGLRRVLIETGVSLPNIDSHE
jgi:hypothetical protein